MLRDLIKLPLLLIALAVLLPVCTLIDLLALPYRIWKKRSA